jgi:GT2 family glycosyltransferase
MLASVVISTYNRSGALGPTLDALAEQDLPPTEYEVLVVDDGSTDATRDFLAEVSQPYRLRIFRLPTNRGVSAGRNLGLSNAEGRYIIMLSDDLIVPQNFITTHVSTLERFPDAWVVGGFNQLESLMETPFGRFLDRLERGFERERTGQRIGPDLYEMTWPTARNLSLRRSDLDRVGLFDEQFRVTCEDQDLGQRARESGVRFLFNNALECIHNDQAADLARYCRFQQRGARDTVRLCEKYPHIHGDAAVLRENGYLRLADGPPLAAKKLMKLAMSRPRITSGIERCVALGERVGVPDVVLHRCYRLLIGLHIFRGFREGLRTTRGYQG